MTLTGTVCPSILPGVHSGILLMILTASLLRLSSTPRSTWILVIEPSVLTTNEHITRPGIRESC